MPSHRLYVRRVRRFACAWLAATLLTCPLSAQTWQPLVSAVDGTKVAYDTSSLSTDGKTAKIWVKMDLSAVKSERARSAVLLWKFNCTDDTVIVLSSTRYLPSGSVLGSFSKLDNQYLYDPVVPGSLSSAAKEVACAPAVADTNRILSQVVLPSEQEAQTLVNTVQGGMSFVDAAALIGFSAGDVYLGSMSKSDLASLTSQSIANTVFSYRTTSLSPVMESPLGWHVFLVQVP